MPVYTALPILRRPNFGTKGRRVRLLTNMYLVTVPNHENAKWYTVLAHAFSLAFAYSIVVDVYTGCFKKNGTLFIFYCILYLSEYVL